MMPGASPQTIGPTRRRTRGTAPRFTHSTYAFRNTSTMTSDGFRTRFETSSSASGTVMDENPYPSAPLTDAAANVIAISARLSTVTIAS